MRSPEQSGGEKKITSPEKELRLGVRGYLEKISESDEDAFSLGQEIDKHADKSDIWKKDEELVGRIGDFLNEHFGHLIRDKEEHGDYQVAQYYRDKLKSFLEDLRGKK